MKSNGSTQYYQQHRVYNTEKISPALNGSDVIPNIVHIKQASTNPVPCQIGGGGGLELPRLQNSQRTSNRERHSLPDSDNGEYP